MISPQRHSTSPRFSLEDIAVRLRDDISRLEYQRQRVSEEAVSPLRTSTIRRYDDMLGQRRLLLDQIEADLRRLHPAVSRQVS